MLVPRNRVARPLSRVTRACSGWVRNANPTRPDTVHIVLDRFRFLQHDSGLKIHGYVICDYQVWQEGSHPQEIQSADRCRQKLDYIHMNPVLRGYVDESTCWRYSSARNYADREGMIEVYRDWFG